jgi:helicase
MGGFASFNFLIGCKVFYNQRMEKKEIVEKVILENKIKELNPMQKEALRMGILDGENLVVSSPTSSGKTLLAELAGLNVTLNKRKKMIYLCPLVALAREKYEDFKRKYQKYGIKVALSIGKFDSITGDQEVLVKVKGEFRKIPIKKLVEENFKRKGFKRIMGKEVCENDEDILIYSFNPYSGKIELKKVKAFIRHKVKKLIYEIKTRTGRKIRVTGDHSLFILDENNFIKPVKTLKLKARKDYIAVPKSLPENKEKVKELNLINHWRIFGKAWVKGEPIKILLSKIWDRLNYKKYPQKYQWRKNKVIPIHLFVRFRDLLNPRYFKELKIQKGGHGISPLILPLDEEFLSFLGLWIADGSFSSKNGISISCGFDNACKDLIRRVAKRFNVFPTETDKGATLIMTASFLRKIMQNIFKLKGGSRKKQIPAFFFSLSNKQIAAFLRGYFSGDGSVNKGEVQCFSTSPNLLKDLQTLLLRLGIISKISEERRTLKIPRKWSAIFKNKIGFLQSFQNKKIPHFSNFSYYEVMPFSQDFMKNNFFEWDYYQGKAKPTTAYLLRTLLPKLNKVAKNKGEKIRKFIFSDILWDEIVEIKKSNFNGYVYDLSVPPFENFVCQNILVKNSSDPWLQQFQWIVASNEKFDSLIRHEAPWIGEIGLVVADEIHLLDDSSRGPTLEILLTILKEILPKAQFLAFSATIRNADEIGGWLGAKVLKSNFRPVPLYKGILFGGKIKLFGFKEYKLSQELGLEESVVENTLLMKKQLIFFLSSRRNAEALAERLSKLVFHFLEEREIEELKELAKKIENALEIPTEQCKKLSKCVEKGVAFYHSGILFSQRVLIEEAYKKGLIKVITSTTALAFGVNLPNFRAVIRDVKRYYPGIGSIYLPVLEVEQMFGRSGRPRYDAWGEGILVAKNREDARELENYYIRGELEEISSKISTESALRMHVLSLISNRFCKSQNQLLDFLKKTFFGKKFKEISILKEKIEEVIFALEDWQFIKTDEIKEDGEVIDKKLMATRIGKRISQLYLDPASANLFIENLRDCQKANEFTIFCLLAKAEEMKPSPNLSMKDAFLIEQEILKNEEYFFFQIPDELDDEYEEFLREAKLATIFSFWIEEETEGEIMEKLKMTPGELHSRIEILDWLLYSILEISKLIPFNEEIKKILKKLRIRAYYGIKEELIPLVSLKGIGRIRARVLFDAGLKTISDLKKASVEKIAKVLKSKSLAEKIKEQI